MTVSARTRTSTFMLAKKHHPQSPNQLTPPFPGLYRSSLGVPCVPSYDPLVLGTGQVQFCNLADHFLLQTSRTSHHQRRHSYMCPCTGLPWDPQLCYAGRGCIAVSIEPYGLVYWMKCSLHVNESNPKWLLKLFPTLDDSVQSEDSICRWPSGCEPTLFHSTVCQKLVTNLIQQNRSKHLPRCW